MVLLDKKGTDQTKLLCIFLFPLNIAKFISLDVKIKKEIPKNSCHFVTFSCFNVTKICYKNCFHILIEKIKFN